MSSSVTKRLGAFEEQSDLFEGRPSFKQKESKLQDGVFLFFDINSGEWRVSQGKTGRISEQAKPVLRNAQNQGCISCGPCSYPELTEDHVLPSA